MYISFKVGTLLGLRVQNKITLILHRLFRGGNRCSKKQAESDHNTKCLWCFKNGCTFFVILLIKKRNLFSPLWYLGLFGDLFKSSDGIDLVCSYVF